MRESMPICYTSNICFVKTSRLEIIASITLAWKTFRLFITGIKNLFNLIKYYGSLVKMTRFVSETFKALPSIELWDMMHSLFNVMKIYDLII